MQRAWCRFQTARTFGYVQVLRQAPLSESLFELSDSIQQLLLSVVSVSYVNKSNLI